MAENENAKKSLFGRANERPMKGEGKKKTWKQELTEWIVTFAVALAVAFVVRSFIFEPVRVDGDSMYPTLHHNEIMYVSKTSYGAGFFGIPFTDIGFYFDVGGDPERFDVIVCHYDDRNKNVVKRIVGLPGDTIELRNGELYVTDRDGVNIGGTGGLFNTALPVDQDFIYHKGNISYGPYTVPAKGDIIYQRSSSHPEVVSQKDLDSGHVVIVRDGAYFTVDDQPIDEDQLPADAILCTVCEEDYYFLLGDNRTNSRDSRTEGPVTRGEIVGKVESVLWHTIPNRLDDESGLKN